MSSMVQDAYDMGITSTLGGLPTWMEDDNDNFYDDHDEEIEDFNFEDEDDEEYDFEEDEYDTEENMIVSNVELYEIAENAGLTNEELIQIIKKDNIALQSPLTLKDTEIITKSLKAYKYKSSNNISQIELEESMLKYILITKIGIELDDTEIIDLQIILLVKKWEKELLY